MRSSRMSPVGSLKEPGAWSLEEEKGQPRCKMRANLAPVQLLSHAHERRADEARRRAMDEAKVERLDCKAQNKGDWPTRTQTSRTTTVLHSRPPSAIANSSAPMLDNNLQSHRAALVCGGSTSYQSQVLPSKQTRGFSWFLVRMSQVACSVGVNLDLNEQSILLLSLR